MGQSNTKEDIGKDTVIAISRSLEVHQGQGEDAHTRRERVRDIVYGRKKFSMFKFVHNKIIERTYQRRNKNNKEKLKGKTSTPLTTKGLRRSSRVNEMNEGHKAPSTQSSMITPLHSSSHQGGL